MAFNLKKAQADAQLPYQKKLEQKRKDMAHKEPDEGATELQLKHNSHKDKDNTVPFNAQLEAARKGTNDGVTEKALDGNSKLYNNKRDDTTHSLNAKSQDLVAESYDQEKTEAFRKAQKGQDRDTSFWDDYVGVQLLGPKTTIVKNKQESQLPNHPDRYSGLKPDLKKKVDQLVMAQMQRADKMQFQIFAQASFEERELNKNEKQMITDINSAKARLLASYENAMKTGQFDDGFIDPACTENGGSPRQPVNNSQVELTIEPDGSGMFDVVEHGTYGRTSVLEGQPSRKIIESFPTAEEAKSHYPEAELLDHQTQNSAQMPSEPPSWFDPNAAGEAWGENDY